MYFCHPVCHQLGPHAKRGHVHMQSATHGQLIDMVIILHISRQMTIKTNSSDAWIDAVTNDSLLSGKNTSCSASPCSSSDASLWPAEDIEKKCLEQDEGCWTCDNQLSLVEEVNSSDTSFVSFSGPYILCQVSYLRPQSVSLVRYPCAENLSSTRCKWEAPKHRQSAQNIHNVSLKLHQIIDFNTVPLRTPAGGGRWTPDFR